MISPKALAYANSLASEAKFFEALARASDSCGFPDLAAAAEEHASVMRERFELALVEAPPKPKPPRAPKPRARRK